MGSCVSVHEHPNSDMKLRLSVGSKDEKVLISTVKHELDTVNGGDRAVADLAVKSQLSSRFLDAGSKDEAFFDSQPWLDSDCEDDFLSVNGDFTPSRGSTPVHHKFSSGNQTVDNAPVTENPFDPDKKRLSELFKESLRRPQFTDEENGESNDNVVPKKSKAEANEIVEPESTSERTPNGVLVAEDESVKSAQCCLPSLRSSGERRKKILSPAHN